MNMLQLILFGIIISLIFWGISYIYNKNVFKKNKSTIKLGLDEESLVDYANIYPELCAEHNRIYQKKLKFENEISNLKK